MAEQKSKPNSKSVSAYIKTLPSEQKIKDAKTALALFKKITKLKPKMWSPTLIGFGKYHYKYESGHEGYAPEMAYSPQKSRHVFYVMNGTKIQNQLLKKLGKYKTGKVCLYINKLADVDVEVLEEILVEAWKIKDERLGC